MEAKNMIDFKYFLIKEDDAAQLIAVFYNALATIHSFVFYIYKFYT